MTKHNKDTDKHNSPDIRHVLINNTNIMYKNDNKNRLQILEAITIKDKASHGLNNIENRYFNWIKQTKLNKDRKEIKKIKMYMGESWQIKIYL